MTDLVEFYRVLIGIFLHCVHSSMTYCVQQLLRWRPLRQYYSLRSEVRELIHDLGCARRRGCCGHVLVRV